MRVWERRWYATRCGRSFWLCGVQNSFAEHVRNCDGQEETLREKVVFTRLVNHTDMTMLQCGHVGQGNIDLSLFKGNRVAARLIFAMVMTSVI